MSLPAFATVLDVEARLRRTLDADEVTQAEVFLDDASDLIRSESGAEWVNADGTALDGTAAQLGALGRVCSAAAARVMRNPGGANQQTAGPFSQSFGTNATPSVYLTKAERKIVARAAGRVGLAVLSTTRGEIETALLTTPPEEGDWLEDYLP